MRKFNHDEGHNEDDRNQRPFRASSRSAKEKLMKRKSFREYRELRQVLNRIQSSLETIIDKKRYSLEQIDALNCDFAKAVAQVSKMNVRNMHKGYFRSLNRSDLIVLNSHMKLFIDQDSYYSFGAIIEETNNGEGIKAQIGDILVSEPKFGELLNRSMKTSIFNEKKSVFKGIFRHEEKAKELSHMLTMQMSYAYGYIIAKDMKNYIKTDCSAIYEKLSGEEIEVLSELYHLISATYPLEHDFEPLDLFPAGIGRTFAKPNPHAALETRDWKDRIDWLHSRMEEMVSEERLLSLQEKRAFDKAVDSLANEISVPQNGDNLEATREKAKLEVKNPFFKAYLSYLKGDMGEFAAAIEIAKNGLIRVMYKVDYDKSLEKKKGTE